MEIKQKYLAHVSVVSAEPIKDKDMEGFAIAIEEAMNKHKIFRLEATLNVYSRGITINSISNNEEAKQTKDV